MEKIKIKQVKSRINCPAVQKKTLDALGLKKRYSPNLGYGREG